MLIGAFAYSENGTDSCKIVVIKQDTFGLVPIQFIVNSNRVKNMNDAQKQLLDSCQKGAFQYVRLVDIQNLEKKALTLVVANQNKDIDKLVALNDEQAKKLNKQAKTITILKYVAIGEGVILVLLGLFK
jgi:hypothetical protein